MLCSGWGGRTKRRPPRSRSGLRSASAWSLLAVQGIIFAHVERLGWFGTLVIVAAYVGLGVVLVGLKLLLTH
jgi:hypothetical protein